MTDSDYTHVTLVVDHSGSMVSMQDSATAGIRRLLTTQHAMPGKLTVTLVEFDHRFHTIARLSSDAFEYSLNPEGTTALLDAVGMEIQNTGSDLRALREDERPGRVLFVVVTDGEENASKEYDLEDVQSLVERQRVDYGWAFQFIGAGQHAWQGRQLRMAASAFNPTDRGMEDMLVGLSAALHCYRAAPLADARFVMPEVNEGTDPS